MFGNFERAIEPESAGIETLEQKIERHDFGQRSGMPQSVRIGRLQYRSAVAIDHDGRKRRRIIFEPGMAMTVPVASMSVMHAGMRMPSCIDDGAGDSERGDDRSSR